MGSIIAAIIGGFGVYLGAPYAMHIISAHESSRAAKQYAEMIERRRKSEAEKGASHGNG